VPVPVGQLCLHCVEPIKQNDCGFVVPQIAKNRILNQPWHRKCFLITVLGRDKTAELERHL